MEVESVTSSCTVERAPLGDVAESEARADSALERSRLARMMW